MTLLTEEQKQTIRSKYKWPEETIYYIEKRCKSCVAGMSLEELVEEAQWLIEEHSFEEQGEQE